MADIPCGDALRQGIKDMELAKAITPGYRKLLRAHYAAPGRTLTTMQLAAVMGWDTHSPVNAHYGAFGFKLAKRMKWPIPSGRPAADAIVTFSDGGPDDPHTRWTMHPGLAAALEAAGVVRPS
jgi:hypothetical protein